MHTRRRFGTTQEGYMSRVLRRKPDHYWPTDEFSGSLLDAIGSSDAVPTNPITYRYPAMNAGLSAVSSQGLGGFAFDPTLINGSGQTFFFWVNTLVQTHGFVFNAVSTTTFNFSGSLDLTPGQWDFQLTESDTGFGTEFVISPEQIKAESINGYAPICFTWKDNEFVSIRIGKQRTIAPSALPSITPFTSFDFGKNNDAIAISNLIWFDRVLTDQEINLLMVI